MSRVTITDVQQATAGVVGEGNLLVAVASNLWPPFFEQPGSASVRSTLRIARASFPVSLSLFLIDLSPDFLAIGAVQMKEPGHLSAVGRKDRLCTFAKHAIVGTKVRPHRIPTQPSHLRRSVAIRPKSRMGLTIFD
jgi:hypothetical protein